MRVKRSAGSRIADIPRWTSANEVVSGDRPRRIESGSRKSGMTLRRDELAREALRASGWRIATCAPRRADSRGEPERSSRAARARRRWTAIAYSVRAMPLARIASMPASADERDPVLGGGQAEDRPACPTSQPPDARPRLVALPHLELVALPEPAPDRLAELVLELAPDVEEGGRAGSAVEVLVGAADGEVDAVLVRGSTGTDPPAVARGPTGRARRRRARAR